MAVSTLDRGPATLLQQVPRIVAIPADVIGCNN